MIHSVLRMGLFVAILLLTKTLATVQVNAAQILTVIMQHLVVEVTAIAAQYAVTTPSAPRLDMCAETILATKTLVNAQRSATPINAAWVEESSVVLTAIALNIPPFLQRGFCICSSNRVNFPLYTKNKAQI